MILALLYSVVTYVYVYVSYIILSGDISIETTPGPNYSFTNQGLEICYWNLSSLSSDM